MVFYYFNVLLTIGENIDGQNLTCGSREGWVGTSAPASSFDEGVTENSHKAGEEPEGYDPLSGSTSEKPRPTMSVGGVHLELDFIHKEGGIE